MHTYPPPKEALDEWLESFPSTDGNYGHLLLEQITEVDEDLIEALKPYFESAHLDAREHFHAQIGISLHPDAAAGAPTVSYPNCLPAKTRRGLFGEVVAGLVTQAYQEEFVGGHEWRVPIFLFRQHDDVEKYLWALRWDPTRTREVYGRHGSDFIGIALNAAGAVVRVIAGEAKWRKRLQDAVVANLMFGPKERNDAGELVHNGRGIWFEMNRDTPIPHGLRQLQRLLEQRDRDGHAAAIVSIDQAVLGLVAPLARTNLVLIIGNEKANREPHTTVIPWKALPEGYTSPHDLQVVEIILSGDGDDLIDALYSSLWQAA
jgi:hypothetical protein